MPDKDPYAAIVDSSHQSDPYANLTTEESEHARQLSPGVAAPQRPLNRMLAPKDETANPSGFDPTLCAGMRRAASRR